MRKDPQERYASAQELANDLRRFLNGEATHARPGNQLGRFWHWCQRRGLAACLVVGIVASLPLHYLLVNGAHERVQSRADDNDRTPPGGDNLEQIYLADIISYADGNLIGQGGWIAGPSEPSVASPHLPVRNNMIDGQTDPSLPSQLSAHHLLSFTKGVPARLELTFDAVAYSASTAGHKRSSNGHVGFGVGNAQPRTIFGFGAGWFPDTMDGLAFWTFSATFLTENRSHRFPLVNGHGFDARVKLGVVIDRVKHEVWGTYDFGSGSAETTRYSVTSEQIAAIDRVVVVQDYRCPHQYVGTQIDNVVVRGAWKSSPMTPLLSLLAP